MHWLSGQLRPTASSCWVLALLPTALELVGRLFRRVVVASEPERPSLFCGNDSEDRVLTECPH